MGELKQWALLFCAAIVAGGLASLLLPSGNSRKAGITALSFFLLAGFIAPINELRADFDPQLESSELLSEQWEEKLAQGTEALSYSLAKDHILKLIQTRLELMDLEVLELDADFSEGEEPRLVSIKISLQAGDQDKETELRALLLREYGLQNVEFFWQEEQ